MRVEQEVYRFVPVTTVSISAGSGASQSATGGSGTGAYSFDAGTSTGCAVVGTTVSVSDASGTCVLTATRLGDNNHETSAASAAFPVTLTRASQTITFATLINRRINESPFTVTATASRVHVRRYQPQVSR